MTKPVSLFLARLDQWKRQQPVVRRVERNHWRGERRRGGAAVRVYRRSHGRRWDVLRGTFQFLFLAWAGSRTTPYISGCRRCCFSWASVPSTFEAPILPPFACRRGSAASRWRNPKSWTRHGILQFFHVLAPLQILLFPPKFYLSLHIYIFSLRNWGTMSAPWKQSWSCTTYFMD